VSVAVVTGASQGIGAAIGRRLVVDGWTVVLAARADERLAAVAQELEGGAGAADPFHCDVSDEASVAALVAHADHAHGCPDLWVNNAGISGRTVPTTHLTREEWDEVLAVNLTGPMLCARAVLPAMAARGSGHIVNIASITGKRPVPQRAAYAASKLGLIGLTRALADEVGPTGVRVNAISPGLVAGPRIERVLAGQAEARGVDVERIRAEFVAATPLGRMVTPEEVADAVVALHGLTGVTGVDFNVAAGLVMY
jgi:NAD(P)-dependent dehydrogenase (short-subunit alcohol dehydrogenase family)